MSKLQELLDRLIGKRSADSDSDDNDAATGDQSTEETPAQEKGDGETEQFSKALELLSGQSTQIIEAVGLLDTHVRELRQQVGQHETVLEGLAKTEVERLQDMSKRGNWFNKLFVASRDAKPVPEDKQKEVQDATVTQEQGGPWAMMKEEDK